MLTPLVAEYLRDTAELLINDPDDADEVSENRDEVWASMSQHERDAANKLVEAVFGQWL